MDRRPALGVDREATNYVARAEKTVNVPALVFHGTLRSGDSHLGQPSVGGPVPNMVDLIEALAADHVMSWNADPDRYDRYLRNFLDRMS